MRIDVLNNMVVLVLRYLHSVNKLFAKKLLYTGIYRNCELFTFGPSNPLNINLGSRTFHRADTSRATTTRQIWYF